MAGLYSPQSLGINADTTGGVFQNGAWYQGRQYFNGTLSDPGVIHPQSDQQGAGNAVSADVIAQTNPQNVAYVNQQRQQQNLPPVPQTGASTPSASASPSGATSSVGTTFTGGGGSGLLGNGLVDLGANLTKQSGIPDLRSKADAIQAQIDTLTKQQGDQISNNNENPFLSNGNRQGREQAITTDFQNKIDALTNEKNSVLGEITSATTDIQNQIGLATQQYQINDQQHQEALGQFNTLMSSGLLSNLSGSDVATIAASTGLPTSVIQDAVTKSQNANVSPQMITDPNSGKVTIIDANTGNIISTTQIPGWTGGSSSTTSNTAVNQNEAVGQVVQEYLSNKNRQAQISPEDLYRELLLQFPNAETYINNNWSAQNIRAATGG